MLGCHDLSFNINYDEQQGTSLVKAVVQLLTWQHKNPFASGYR